MPKNANGQPVNFFTKKRKNQLSVDSEDVKIERECTFTLEISLSHNPEIKKAAELYKQNSNSKNRDALFKVIQSQVAKEGIFKDSESKLKKMRAEFNGSPEVTVTKHSKN